MALGMVNHPTAWICITAIQSLFKSGCILGWAVTNVVIAFLVFNFQATPVGILEEATFPVVLVPGSSMMLNASTDQEFEPTHLRCRNGVVKELILVLAVLNISLPQRCVSLWVAILKRLNFSSGMYVAVYHPRLFLFQSTRSDILSESLDLNVEITDDTCGKNALPIHQGC